MSTQKLVDGFKVDHQNSPMPDCEACVQAKQMLAPFLKHAENCARNPGELTHTDLWESRSIGHGGFKYFISFMDDCSRHVTINFLQTKDQAAEKLKGYVACLECQYNFVPKVFRADNSSEYVSHDLVNWCELKGIKLEYTAPHSPEQNGVAE